MNNLHNASLTFFKPNIFGFCVPKTNSFRKQNRDPLEMRFKGTVVNNNNFVKSFQLNVYRYGRIFHSEFVTNGKFSFSLKASPKFEFEFEAMNHFRKRIIFYTQKESDQIKSSNWIVDVTLISKTCYPELKSVKNLTNISTSVFLLDGSGNYFDIKNCV